MTPKVSGHWKTTETDTHVFFLKGPFSQWHPSGFTQEVINRGVMAFTCAEQFMMASKASLFGDEARFNAIMATSDPANHKTLGRQVANFDSELWEANCEEIVFQANLAKFSQNPDDQIYMLNTGDKILVEGAAYDRVWGVGLAWNDPAILDPANWQGRNLLGKSLMRVRDVLQQDLSDA